MASEPPSSVPPPPATSPPGPEASRDQWRAWRHQQRAQGHYGGWYGPWGWGWGGSWGWYWGAALVVIGAYYLLSNLGLLTWLKGDVLWPTLLILLGVVLLVRRGRGFWP